MWWYCGSQELPKVLTFDLAHRSCTSKMPVRTARLVPTAALELQHADRPDPAAGVAGEVSVPVMQPASVAPNMPRSRAAISSPYEYASLSRCNNAAASGAGTGCIGDAHHVEMHGSADLLTPSPRLGARSPSWVVACP